MLTFSKMKSFVKLTRIHLDDLKLVSEGVLSKKKNLNICLTLKLFMLAHTLKSPKQEDQGEFEASLG